jgi:hypothetical protein
MRKLKMIKLSPSKIGLHAQETHKKSQCVLCHNVNHSPAIQPKIHESLEGEQRGVAVQQLELSSER